MNLSQSMKIAVKNHWKISGTAFLGPTSASSLPLRVAELEVTGDIALTGGLTIGGDITLGNSFAADATIFESQARMDNGTAARPSMAWKDAGSDWDTGFWLDGADTIGITVGGTNRWYMTSTVFGATVGSKPQMRWEDATATNPNIIPNRNNNGTGVGAFDSDTLSLIADSTEVMRISDTQIDAKVPLNIGAWSFPEDAGVVTAMDMAVSSTPSDGDEMSYTFRLDSSNILKIKGSADGSGGADELKLVSEVPIHMAEMATPTAIADYGAIYTKSDNKLYFQDGGGTEHEIAHA